MHDLADRLAADIDRAAHHAPAPGPSVDAVLGRGRRALLRRRIAVGVGTAAAAVAIGGTLSVVAPGGHGSATDPQVATQPSSAPAEDPDQAMLAEDDLLAGYDADGRLVVRDGWTVTQRIANPAALPPPAGSIALELTNGSKSYWYYLHRDDDGWGASSDPARKGFATLAEWTASQAEANRPDPIGAALDLRPDGTLVSSDGEVVIVDQRTGVDLGAAYGPAADTTVAELRVDGVRWFVSALDHVSGGWELGPPIDTPEAGTTLDSYVAYLKAQYESGEGVR